MDGQLTYSLSGNHLTVRDATDGSILIEDYRDGALGIQLTAPAQQRTGQVNTINPYGVSADTWDVFQNMRSQVAQKHEELDVSRTPEEIDRIAAAMTFSYYRDRIESMAHLQPSVDSNQKPHLNGSLVMYEKYPPTFVTNHSATNIGQALQMPVQESFEQLAQLQQYRQREEQLAQTKMQTAGYEHPSLRHPGDPQGPTIG